MPHASWCTACESILLSAAAAAGAAGLFRQQAAVATHTHWQLLQLAPTNTPGIFKVGFLGLLASFQMHDLSALIVETGTQQSPPSPS